MAQPHFTSINAFLEGVNLCVAFKEAGLGNNQLITYILSANATAEYACIYKGAQYPQASNKEAVSVAVSTTATLKSDKNGKVINTICLSPGSPTDLSCPPGKQLVLVSVTYNVVTLTDTINQISIGVSGNFSDTFVDLV
ncbi:MULTISPECIES: hypothetical protein [unclassified Clostridium]|uniref:hypothetical protein n=1 Tax=unclassified Clostridium TaxID=2614128 RepID=UPI0002978683|nr:MULTISPECIES: hypothetical protein [unclassified Clostridium]EKQ51320.1 MAG: hypothetical protein A370_04930 [Clostridium sp. Maddingley MBC34-26]